MKRSARLGGQHGVLRAVVLQVRNLRGVARWPAALALGVDASAAHVEQRRYLRVRGRQDAGEPVAASVASPDFNVLLASSLHGVADPSQGRVSGESNTAESIEPPNHDRAAGGCSQYAGTPPPRAVTSSGLRSGGFVSAVGSKPSTLELIKSELEQMRREAEMQGHLRKEAAAKAARDTSAKLARQRERALRALHGATAVPEVAGDSTAVGPATVDDDPVVAHFLQRSPPPVALLQNRASYKDCRSENEMLEGVREQSQSIRRRLQRDADEVLRKKDETFTWKYVKILFPRVGADSRSEVMVFCDMLVQRVHEKQSELRLKVTPAADTGAITEELETMLRKAAWVCVLDDLSDAELRRAADWGLIDPTHMSDAPESEAGADIGEWDIDFSDVEAVSELLGRVRYTQEIVSSIQDTALRGLPTEDLAPVLRKAELNRFEDISASELRLLEQYEEQPSRDIAAAQPETASTAEGVGRGPSGQQPTEMAISEAMFNRALAPSNFFLHKVAEKDPQLKQAMSNLERIKRQALLDHEFQAALKYAHAIEVSTAAPILHNSCGSHMSGDDETMVENTGAGVGGDDNASRASPGRKRAQLLRRLKLSNKLQNRRVPTPRQQKILDRWSPSSSSRLSSILPGGAPRGRHAADVPFFYGDIRSHVPPRGDFNLPQPRPSKEERATLRRFARHSRRRFTR